MLPDSGAVNSGIDETPWLHSLSTDAACIKRGSVTPLLPIRDDKQNDKRVGQSSQVITPRRTRTYDPLIKSRKSQHFDAMESTTGQQGQAGESECQQMPESLGNKGDSAITAVDKSASGVQASDCAGCSGGRSSDKQNDKQNDKRVSTDPDLQQVIDAWANLPEIVKAGMLAMVNASEVQK